MDATPSKSVLIADDDKTTRLIIERLVQRWGYHPISVVDGNAAWQYIKNSLEKTVSAHAVPNLAIIDWIMPGFNGLELCQKIKQQTQAFIYVILLTGRTTPGDMVKALDAGADDFLTKPVQTEELRSRLAVGDRINRYQQMLAVHNQQLQAEIARRKQIEEQLRQTHLEKNKFLGMAAHDLRNPLSSIRGFSELLLEDHLDPQDRHEFLTIIHQTSQEMLLLINDLLDISMIESGRFELNLQLGRLDELVTYRAHLNTMLAQRKQITLEVQAPLPVSVEFDAPRMAQVVDNLLTNAIKYSPVNSRVTIQVQQDHQQALIKVIDQGVGIPLAQQHKLFGAFQRLSSRPTAGESSTGLGLAIVKRIIEAHHGAIQVESQPGLGSCFTVCLPLPALTNHAMDTIMTPTPLKVLLVDDERNSRYLLSVALKKMGFKVIAEADNGEQAIAYYRLYQPDLTLLDINMPTMDGRQALEKITAEFPQAIIIMLTSLSDQEMIQACLNGGAANYIRKDFSQAEILQRIQETWDAYAAG